MARPAFHEEPDDRLRPDGIMRRSRRQGIQGINIAVRSVRKETVHTEHVAKCQRAEAAAAFGKEIAARSGWKDVGSAIRHFSGQNIFMSFNRGNSPRHSRLLLTQR